MSNNNLMPYGGHIGYIVAEYADDNDGGQVGRFDNNVIVDTNCKYTSGQTEHGTWQRNVERSTAVRTGEVKHPHGTTRYVERVQVRRDQKIEYTPSSSSSNRLESNWNDNNAVARSSYKKGGGGGGGGGKRSSGSGYYQGGGGGSRRNGGGYNQSYYW